jgi:hypothetical protein
MDTTCEHGPADAEEQSCCGEEPPSAQEGSADTVFSAQGSSLVEFCIARMC